MQIRLQQLAGRTCRLTKGVPGSEYESVTVATGRLVRDGESVNRGGEPCPAWRIGHIRFSEALVYDASWGEYVGSVDMPVLWGVDTDNNHYRPWVPK